MANRKEARQSEIDLSLEVHEMTSKLASETSAASPASGSTKDRGYFKSLLNEILTEELGVDPEVHAIFQEAQSHVLVTRNDLVGNNLTYQLLDEGFSPKNPLCHPEANEDRYDEESLP